MIIPTTAKNVNCPRAAYPPIANGPGKLPTIFPLFLNSSSLIPKLSV